MNKTDKKIDGKYDYFAFIAYKHNDEEGAKKFRFFPLSNLFSFFALYKSKDEKAAKKLYRKLQVYGLPGKLVREKRCHKRLSPIFLDIDFPAGVEYEEADTDYLNRSKFLIVICSEELAKDPKEVNNEIVRFLGIDKEKERERAERIIVLTLNNEKDDFLKTYPEKLKELNKKYNNISKPYPLNHNSHDREIREASFISVVAKMHGIEVAELAVLEHKRKKKKWTLIIAFLVAFCIYTGYMLNQIILKNKELQIENSKNLVALSEQYWSTGNGAEAIEAAVAALPGEEKKPVVPAAIRILSNETGVFYEKNFLATRTLKCDDDVTAIGYAGNGTSIVSQDSTGIYFWDAKTGKLKKKYLNNDFYDSYFLNLYFDSTDVLVEGKYGFYKLDGASGNLLWEIKTDDSKKIYNHGTTGITGGLGTHAPNAVTDTNIIISYFKYNKNSENIGYDIEIYDRNTGMKTGSLSLDTGEILDVGYIEYVNDKIYCCIRYYNRCEIVSFDVFGNRLINKKIIYTFEKADMTANKIQFVNNSIYMTNSNFNTFGNEYMTEVIKFDINEKKKWIYTYKNDFNYGYSNDCFNNERLIELDADECQNFCDILTVVNGNSVELINADTGNHIYSYQFDDMICQSYYSSEDGLSVITEGGGEYIISLKEIAEDQIDQGQNLSFIQIHQFTNRHKYYARYGHNYVAANQNSNEIYLYREIINESYKTMFEVPFDGSTNIHKAIVNNSKTYIAVVCFDKVYIKDIIANKLYPLNYSSSDGEKKYTMFFSDDVFVIADPIKTVIDIFDVKTGDKICTKSIGKNSVRFDVVAGKLVFVKDSRMLGVMNEDYEIYYWQPSKFISPGNITEEKGCIKNSSLFFTNKSGKVLTHNEFSSGDDLQIYDVNNGSSVQLEINVSEINKIITAQWLNDGRVVIAFKDKTIRVYNTNSGKLVKKFICDIPLTVSLVSLENDRYIGVLCTDSVLYKISLKDGVIYNRMDLNPEFMTSASNGVVSERISGLNRLIISGGHGYGMAYVIDPGIFEICYEIHDYAGYLNGPNPILIYHHNKISIYPLYSVSKLVDNAKRILYE